MSCCARSYQEKFDAETARAEMSNYLDQGIKKNSKPLLSLLLNLDLKNHTLLDVGGGIGAISFELLKEGISHTTLVDLSPHYVSVFEKEAKKRQIHARSEAYQGDILDWSADLTPSDLLVMDKVICCYPNFKPLMEAVIDLSVRWVAFSLPRNTWWVKAGQWFNQKWRQITGDSFRTYIHPTAEIYQQLQRGGFTIIELQTWREWEYVLCERGTG